MIAWYVLLALWLGWWVSWMIAARWATNATASAPATSEMSYRAITVAGVALLFLPLQSLSSALTLYTPSDSLVWTAVALAAAGFAFCWWARIALGTLWSSNVTRKADHHIVDTGPYALVRHPIYTGVILAALATALAKGTALAFAGAALMAVSFYVKARLEEQFLRQELGPEAYDSYRKRVPMLLPFWPFG